MSNYLMQNFNLNKEDNVKDKMKWISTDYDLTQPIHPILILRRFLQLIMWKSITRPPSSNALYLKQYSIDSWRINLIQRIKVHDQGD